eukprot:scaffold13706_cov98-Cylindrotheca_fusiformis.AAC.3
MEDTNNGKLKSDRSSSDIDGSRRLVVFIGPPKTGTTSLQEFLFTHSTIEKRSYAKAFKGWNYPNFFNNRAGLREIVKGTDHRYYKRIRKIFESQKKSLNLVVASENLINYDQFLDGKVFHLFSNWTDITTPEIVIHYRRPRIEHVLSIWKQFSQVSHGEEKRFRGCTFQQFVCSEVTKPHLRNAVFRLADPIGVAHDMVQKYKLPTYMIDMEGAAEQGVDLSHAFACSIMKVKCIDKNRWVHGLRKDFKHLNSRTGNANITKKQYEHLERTFHQRDCAYRDELRNHSLFHFLFQHNESWPNNCDHVGTVPAYRHDSSSMIDEMRRIVGCPGYESRHARQVVRKHKAQEYIQLTGAVPIRVAGYALVVVFASTVFWKRKSRKSRGGGKNTSE